MNEPTFWCSQCGGTACEYNCGRDGDREGCERGNTAAYGPDAHRICTKCKGYPERVEPSVVSR